MKVTTNQMVIAVIVIVAAYYIYTNYIKRESFEVLKFTDAFVDGWFIGDKQPVLKREVQKDGSIITKADNAIFLPNRVSNPFRVVVGSAGQPPVGFQSPKPPATTVKPTTRAPTTFKPIVTTIAPTTLKSAKTTTTLAPVMKSFTTTTTQPKK